MKSQPHRLPRAPPPPQSLTSWSWISTPIGRINQDFRGRALPDPRPDGYAVIAKLLHDLIGSESFDTESDVRPERCGPAPLDQRDKLRSRSDP